MNKEQLIIELDPRERLYGMLQIYAYSQRYMDLMRKHCKLQLNLAKKQIRKFCILILKFKNVYIANILSIIHSITLKYNKNKKTASVQF